MIIIKTNPVAKGRPKFFRKGAFVGTYTPAKTKEAEDVIRKAVAKAWKGKPWDGPIGMVLNFYMPRPKSMPKGESWLFHVKRPDLDNLEKAVADALNGVAFVDDSQICRKVSSKQYGNPPRIELIIFNAEEHEPIRPPDSPY